jgi:hypothetical protein
MGGMQGVYSFIRADGTCSYRCVLEGLFFFRVMASPYWASRSYSDTLHSVGLLWANDQPDPRDLYLTTRSIHERQTSMPLAGYEPTIPASERPQTHVLDRSATGIGLLKGS